MIFRGFSRVVGVVSFVLIAADACAQLFAYRQGAENFEAPVSADRLIVKERYQGASTIYGDLACPLGPAVRAAALPGAESRLCFTFPPDQCEYTRFQDGSPIHSEELATGRLPRLCIALASAVEAHALAKLVNSGPQQVRTPSADAPEESKRNAASVDPAAVASEPTSLTRETSAPSSQRSVVAAGSAQSSPARVGSYSSGAGSRPARTDSTERQSRIGTRLALYVHVRNPKQRADVERLVEPLAARGIRVTGIKLMDKGPLGTDLRYFYADDARQTGVVLRVLRTFGVTPVAKHIRGFETTATPQQYELWLSPDGLIHDEDRPRPRSVCCFVHP